jgi:hypothetical protein
MLSGMLGFFALAGSAPPIDETANRDVDRERGVITDADRAYLRRSEAERKENYSRTALYQRQKHIYNRTENAVLDIPILARHGDDELYRYLFSSEVDDGRKKTADTARTQRAYSDVAVFLIRGVLADEPERPIETTDDLEAVLRPMMDEIETGIEEWLNRERDRTAAFELTPSIETVQTINGLVEELELRRSSLDAEERIENAKILERAGYDDAEITALIGEEPDGDDEPKSEYPVHQLVEFPLETLTELVADGEITEDEHTEAIRQKAASGDIDGL